MGIDELTGDAAEIPLPSKSRSGSFEQDQVAEEWIYRKLSKVEIIERIGGAGMDKLYQGVHTTLNRSVAVKILHGHLARDSQLLRRTHDEAQAAASLRYIALADLSLTADIEALVTSIETLDLALDLEISAGSP
jgi:serine/threonine protein kinase